MSATRPPRIEPLSPPYPSALEAEFERITPSWRNSGPLAIFRVWARHPGLGRSLGPVGAFLLGGGDLADADRELLILRTCALAGSEYEWGVHAVGYARRAGLADELIEATACVPTDDPRWTAHERRLLRLVDEAESSVSVSDELWNDLATHYTDAQLLELLLVAGFYRYVALTARATRTPLEPWAMRFPDRRLSSRS